MEELKFVIKCLIFACIITIFSQTKIQDQTIEAKTAYFFSHSESAKFIRGAAAGGVNLLLKSYNTTSDFIYDKTGRRLSKTHFDAKTLFEPEVINENFQQGAKQESLNEPSQISKRPIHSSPVFEEEKAEAGIQIEDLDKTSNQ